MKKLILAAAVLSAPTVLNAATYTIEIEASIRGLNFDAYGAGNVSPEQHEVLLNTGVCIDGSGPFVGDYYVVCGGLDFDLLAVEGQSSYDRDAAGFQDIISATIEIDEALVGDFDTRFDDPIFATLHPECSGSQVICDTFVFGAPGRLYFNGERLFAGWNSGDVVYSLQNDSFSFHGFMFQYGGQSSIEVAGLTLSEPSAGSFFAHYGVDTFNVIAPTPVPLPAGYLFLVSGVALLGCARRNQRTKQN